MFSRMEIIWFWLVAHVNALQTLLVDVSLAANNLQLSFRPDKCASLSLTCNSKGEPSRVGDTVFSVQGGNIPVLLKGVLPVFRSTHRVAVRCE